MPSQTTRGILCISVRQKTAQRLCELNIRAPSHSKNAPWIHLARVGRSSNDIRALRRTAQLHGSGA